MFVCGCRLRLDMVNAVGMADILLPLRYMHMLAVVEIKLHALRSAPNEYVC